MNNNNRVKITDNNINKDRLSFHDEKETDNSDSSENKEKADILERTGREYFQAANEEFLKERHNSVVVLYFKALTSFTDLFLLKETGDSPSSHSDRFRKTKEEFPDIYDILDKDFPFYQSSYISILTKELAEVMKDDAKTLAEKSQIEL